MKENVYDKASFYESYSNMERSVKGLEGAGEWYALRDMLPPLAGKRALDLGCGFGWHCRYAAEQGASEVLGIDLSERMLDRARALTDDPRITYRRVAIEDLDCPAGAFDVVLSSLAFHYVASFDAVCATVSRCLAPGGAFVFSVEHPVFTAAGTQAWHTGPEGELQHWPVDRYFSEGERSAVFLGEAVTKYHRTLTGYFRALKDAGFLLIDFCEPEPDPVLLDAHPEYRDELRRPMFALFSAKKQ